MKTILTTVALLLITSFAYAECKDGELKSASQAIHLADAGIPLSEAEAAIENYSASF